MSFLDVTIVNIAFPSIRAEFAGVSLAALSWVINAYSIVFAAALVPMGRWADRVGRRRVFLAGVGLFVAASAGCAAAPTVEVLIAARMVQALGAAAVVPTSLALLLPEFPPQRRAIVTAIWSAAGAVAAAVGPSVGGLLVQAGGWRLVFLINLPIGAAALVASLLRGRTGQRLLREAADPDAVPADTFGALLLAAGIAALSLGIVAGPDWGWTSPSVATAFTAALLMLAAFLFRCVRYASARDRAPVVELGLFRVRSFAAANAATVVFAIGFYGLLLANVLFVTGVWGYSTVWAGVALTPGALMAALVAPLAGRLADRFGQRVLAVPGGLVFAAGAALLAVRMDATPDYLGHLLPAMLLTGVGIGLTISSLGSAAVAELPRQRFATGSAITACLRQIGAVVGVAVLFAVLSAYPAAPRAGAPAGAPAGFAVEGFRAAWWVMRPPVSPQHSPAPRSAGSEPATPPCPPRRRRRDPPVGTPPEQDSPPARTEEDDDGEDRCSPDRPRRAGPP